MEQDIKSKSIFSGNGKVGLMLRNLLGCVRIWATEVFTRISPRFISLSENDFPKKRDKKNRNKFS